MFGNNYYGKKVLITGHTGFKGSWLAVWLQTLGAEVVGVALPSDTDPAHFSLLKLDMQSHIGDIRHYEKLEQVIRNTQPEIIFHLAAQPLVRDSYENPLYTLETNVIGTANVLNACRDLKSLKAVVVVTTDKCYENKEWVWGYREIDPMGGYDPYSASKGCAELVTASFRNSYFNLERFGKTHSTLIASARAGNVIGGGDWAKDRLVPDIVRATANYETVMLRNPQSTRPWQHVLESLSGYLTLGAKLLEGDARFAEGWNFAPTQEGDAKVLDVVAKMHSYWPALKYEVHNSATHPHEAHLLKLDCSKANAILRWNNVWDFAKTIEATTNWYRGFYEDGKLATENDIANYTKDAQALFIPWAVR